MTELKLGKKPATIDHRDLLFGEFVKRGLSIPTAPTGFGHENLMPYDWGMLGNDQYGDCVFAGGDHETMMLNAIRGYKVEFTKQQALADYAAVTGFNVNDPNSDQGTDMRTAMNYRRKTGLVDITGSRHKIGAYVALEPGNWNQHLEALYVFDCVAIGIEFPDYAMAQFNAGKPWSYRTGGTIEGGHYIPIVGRPTSTYLDIVTWGKVTRMGRGFFTHYNDESYAFLTVESLKNGKTAEGYDLVGLKAALGSL